MSWKIKECSDLCRCCDNKFKEQDAVYSVLVYSPEGPIRKDVCASCWERGAKREDRFSYWQVQYHTEPKPIVIKPKTEYYVDIVNEKIESAEKEDRLIIYFLGLFLERRKRFIARTSSRNSENIYEDRETGNVYVLQEPELTTAELLHASNDITKIIDDLIAAKIPSVEAL